MNKFNHPQRNLLKERRARRANLRRLHSGNPNLKISSCPPAKSVSGKQKRKLLKKWRRAQKDALETGLVSMQDIEMIAADNSGGEQGAQEVEDDKAKHNFHIKRRAKLRLMKSSKRGKHSVAKPSTLQSEDVIMQ